MELIVLILDAFKLNNTGHHPLKGAFWRFEIRSRVRLREVDFAEVCPGFESDVLLVCVLPDGRVQTASD